jgi:hypothetical protein
VFADEGQTVITDQVFPSADSDGVELFAEGGSATLDSLKVRHLRSSLAIPLQAAREVLAAAGRERKPSA